MTPFSPKDPGDASEEFRDPLFPKEVLKAEDEVGVPAASKIPGLPAADPDRLREVIYRYKRNYISLTKTFENQLDGIPLFLSRRWAQYIRWKHFEQRGQSWCAFVGLGEQETSPSRH